MTTPRQRTWALGTSDAESVVAEARKALFVMVAFLAILWIVQLANVLEHYQLTADYGIRPHAVSSLPDIAAAPFLHVSWTHIESNSGPLFIFGFLAAYRGVVRFLGLTGLVIIGSGLAAWLFSPPGTIGVGASGVVFGYLGYILVRGFFDRHAIDILIGAVMALCFAYQFTVLLPHAGIGWQAHIGGLVAGVIGGWVFRDRAAATARKDAAAAVSPAAGGAGRVSATTTAPVISALPTARGPAAATPAAASARDVGSKVTSKSDLYTGPRGDLHRQLDDMGL